MYGWHLEAQYEDGFVLTQDETDQSPYNIRRNVYHAIVNSRPTDYGHGRLVRFSLICDTKSALSKRKRYDVDWRDLWQATGATPVYYREMQIKKHEQILPGSNEWTEVPDSAEEATCIHIYFGYEYIDDFGVIRRQIEEVK